MSFARYVALGDSLSLDLYPALDAGAADVAVALEWRRDAGAVAPVGAASLLLENDGGRWPEFVGHDLRTHSPGVEHLNLAADGATIGDVFGEQLPEVGGDDRPTLATLTVGLEDLFSAIGSRPRPALLARAVRDIMQAYDYLVAELRRLLPQSTVLLTTIYDPSDRSGRIPGVLEEVGPLPLAQLDALNAHIRELAARTAGARLADVYAHFLGHGASVAERERWYWRRSLVEPSALGASEIRRVWLAALGEAP